ncbi:tRNA (adenosine(37)-N6)-threonylcarbamoyltransferase complex dimerization subunit type 1 TsaB [Deferribacter thermophilus]|uniref:tRNA (adenosine(37)-N6)-threonylcarbamoyltransferase complex dimerization subunit type 1 TsaB n=1 Tax=Deferribacter thermophilus TaxID=53573 RepID=UPI003C2078B0
MRVLFLDSSSNKMSLAIYENEYLLHLSLTELSNKFNEELLDFVDIILKKLSLTISDIDNFFVITGPGSFTGIRIGVSTLLGLALGNKKKVFGISTLDAAALVINKFYNRDSFRVGIKLRLKEYAVREYNFGLNNFSDYRVENLNSTQDLMFVDKLEIPLTYAYLHKKFEHFVTDYNPFYMRKSQAEINFDKKSCT